MTLFYIAVILLMAGISSAFMTFLHFRTPVEQQIKNDRAFYICFGGVLVITVIGILDTILT